ncbi:MAG: LD-carboxypeptidase [Pseudomonadota bacterium]
MSISRALKKGDVIGIAAPASPFDRNKFNKGIRVLEALGFKTLFRKDIFDQNRYFAGTEDRRAAEFTELMQNKEVSAVMFARGGYGSQRVIPLLDAKVIEANKKPVIGFSDITALLAYLRQSAGVPTMYGPVITLLGSIKGDVTPASLWAALTTKGPIGQLACKGVKILKPGKATGPLVGGCMSLINSSIGTPYELKSADCILFLEDAGEKMYVLDRMLTQLKMSGAIEKAKGIIFGPLKSPDGEEHEADEMIGDVLKDFKGPIITSFPTGHTDEFVTLPLGAKTLLDASSAEEAPTLTYIEGLLE